MPNIVVNNISKEGLILLSNKTLNKLVEVVKCPSDWFNYMDNANCIVVDNEVKKDIVYVKIEWFAREKQIEKEVVKIISEALKDLAYQEIVVYFEVLDKDYYYET